MKKYNLIYIVIDSLRPDYLSCYCADKNHTPTINKLAEKGVFFENVFSVSTVTPVVFSTLLTGAYPYEHGIKEFSYILSDKKKTLAELFGEKGYRTGAVAGSIVLDSSRGFDRGFDYYDDKFEAKSYLDNRNDFKDYNNEVIYRHGEVVVDLAKKWINRNSQDNFFLFLHFWDNHLPYNPPRDLISKKAQNYRGKADGSVIQAEKYNAGIEKLSDEDLSQFQSLYAASTRHIDNCIQDLLGFLEEKGISENSSIILTADHGEALGEYDYIGHGRLLYEKILQVPLILSGPIANKYEDRKVSNQISNADIFPAIINNFELESKESNNDKLLNLKNSKSILYSETYFPKKFVNKRIAIKNGAWKYIREPFGKKPTDEKNLWQSFKIYVHRFKKGKGNRIFLLRKLFDRFIGRKKQFLWGNIENVLQAKRGLDRELYNLATDPLEQDNLINKRVEMVGKLDKELKQLVLEKAKTEVRQMKKTSEMEEKLKSLGYM